MSLPKNKAQTPGLTQQDFNSTMLDNTHLENIYMKITDKNGQINDKFLQLLEKLDIEPQDLIKKRIVKLKVIHDELLKKRKASADEFRHKKRYKIAPATIKLEPLQLNSAINAYNPQININQNSNSNFFMTQVNHNDIPPTPSKVQQRFNSLNPLIGEDPSGNKRNNLSTFLHARKENSMMVSPNHKPFLGEMGNNGHQTPNITKYRQRHDPTFQSFDLQREREKLFKFLKIKENSFKLREDLSLKMQEMMNKKELKLKKIQDRFKKDMKDKSQKIQKVEIQRETKKQWMNDRISMQYENADLEYQKYLDELRKRQQEKELKQKEMCLQEYKQYQRNFMKSQGNFHVFKKTLEEQARKTTVELDTLETRLNSHRERSVMIRDQVRQQIHSSLTRVAVAKEQLLLKHEAEEEQRLREFLERQDKKKAKLEKHEKAKQKMLNQKAQKNFKNRQNHSVMENYEDNSEMLMQSIMSKQNQIEQKIQTIKQKRQRDNQLKHERYTLVEKDHKRKQEKQKSQRERLKSRIFEKYLQIEEKVQKIRQSRASQIEFSRLAHEVQKQKVFQNYQ
ncbi:UNKNOWN [Stylonychia lemnae]|uniref:Uncharacterized protein n=1 Tax=Stylonychia lemnae TaxID=5949 RepID=A0A078ACW2_STYLE|nr:UNKNOWN [Stylonychia lemnae]|eukprot:CDW78688.1 UNKNOWN [Stylonychia lemnae]